MRIGKQHRSPNVPPLEETRAELEHIQKRRRGMVQVPSVDEVKQERDAHRKAADRRNGHFKEKQIAMPSMEEVQETRQKMAYRTRFWRVLLNTIGSLIVVAACAALVATLYLPVLQVSGSSMEPTLDSDDIIVLIKNERFETGDLVGLYYNGKIMLKRVIAGAGDYVNIDADGSVYVNGTYLYEPYITGKSLGDCNIELPYQVPDGCWFVLGDHRSMSMDSRNAAIGCIRTENIIGEVLFRIWPLNRIGRIQ